MVIYLKLTLSQVDEMACYFSLKSQFAKFLKSNNNNNNDFPERTLFGGKMTRNYEDRESSKSIKREL